jgi:hypothetical protein
MGRRKLSVAQPEAVTRTGRKREARIVNGTVFRGGRAVNGAAFRTVKGTAAVW